MRLYLTVILFLIFLAIAFVFGSQNDQTFTLNYFIARIDISVAAAVSLFTIVGFILGLLFCFLWKLINVVSPKKSKK
ncbi:lipopolysaccharide assembly protein LapA domain-containing protein [Pseudocolwellia sp. HL-MZ19]|uniref:lipopolysaccharide assembly protein LapA domain-containing protein n=1 Tax=unclassified Pseudocolwellia TaxID=2848178 RepID=UPI003CE9B684